MKILQVRSQCESSRCKNNLCSPAPSLAIAWVVRGSVIVLLFQQEPAELPVSCTPPAAPCLALGFIYCTPLKPY